MLRLSDESLERIAGDAVVWSHSVSRLGEFRCVVMTAADRSRLVEAFGETWLESHLHEQRKRLDVWAATGVEGLVH